MALHLTLARPYAAAAFEYAVAQKSVVAWENFCNLASATVRNTKTQAFLSNPGVSEQQILKMFALLLKSEMDSHQCNFLKTLIYYKRLELMPQIAILFDALRTEHEKTLTVGVASAFPLGEQQLLKLSQALKIRLQREITLKVKEEPSLLGGVIITAEDFVIDGSVRSQLERMKTSIQA